MNSILGEIKVRPDYIDMNSNVHNAKYLDYVPTARYEQMKNKYEMSMDEFIENGFNWVVSLFQMDWKRALSLGDTTIVRAQLDSVNGAQCKVNFRIENKKKNKLVSSGYFLYTIVSTNSGIPTRITEDIIERYSN